MHYATRDSSMIKHDTNQSAKKAKVSFNLDLAQSADRENTEQAKSTEGLGPVTRAQKKKVTGDQ